MTEGCVEDDNTLFVSKEFKEMHQQPCRVSSYCEHFHAKLRKSIENLQKDGLFVDLFLGGRKEHHPVVKMPTTIAGKMLQQVINAMKDAGHTLHRGAVYCKHPDGK